MSVSIPVDSIPIEKRRKMVQDLRIKTFVKRKGKRVPSQVYFDNYEVRGENVIMPFAYYFHNIGDSFPNNDLYYPPNNAKFVLELFDRQKNIRSETLEILNTYRSILLALRVAFGKTLYTIYIISSIIKLKAVIFAHRIILIDQWKISINKCCPNAKVQILDSRCKVDPDADFYIINITNVPKRHPDDFRDRGVLVIDEMHATCSEKYSQSYRYVFPKYIIGLTATPERADGKDSMIDHYVGPTCIYVPLKALYNVYLCYTGFSPKAKTNENGDLNWNEVIKDQYLDRNRNTLIIDIIRYFTARNILVLCKRKNHVKLLHMSLQKYGIDSDVYMGSQKIVNYDCRVLISTTSKSGVGFDHPKLDMLIVAGDMQELFVQYLGRVFRRDDNLPIIVDLVDKFFPLKKHFEGRTDVYKASQGEIKNLENYFTQFNSWRGEFRTNLESVYNEMTFNEEEPEEDD